MIVLIFLILTAQNTITDDLNIVKNDYQSLLYYYQAPFLIKNEKEYINKLENLKYINRNSEPLYIKLLNEFYIHSGNNKKIKKLNKKYGVINKFNIYQFKNIELFEELPINLLKNKYESSLIKFKRPQKLKKGLYILETTCKFKHKHSVYLYNDLTDSSCINNKKTNGNAFIIKGSNKYFKLSLKLNNKKNGLIYIKGASCDVKNKNNRQLELASEITVQKVNTIVNIKNEEVYLPNNKLEIEELIKENTPLANYKLYNFYLLNNLPNEAYKYLTKWAKRCINYYSQRETQDFYKEYIPAFSKNKEKILYVNKALSTDKALPYPITTPHSQKIQQNEIIEKNIVVKKEAGKYYQYIHYLISVKDATKFIDYFRIPSSVDILGVYSIINGKKTPLETKFTENEIFLKEIENNMLIELYTKSKIKNIIFIPEKYFNIQSFSIKFSKNIKYKLINSHNYNLINKNQAKNIKAYFKMPFEANTLDFLPYYVINVPIKAPTGLKWYYFYKNLSYLEIPDSINKINDIKKAYYFLYSKKIENKALVFYRWSKLKKLNTKLLIFHIKNDIYNNKLFNYPIIQYKNQYLDLNTPYLGFGVIPRFLKNKEYITIDNKGAYLYKRHEKILKNFVKNNKVVINYKILKDLDYAEFEMNITLNDFYTTGLRNMLKIYKNEEVIAKILELYVNTKIKNTSLIDYEIKKTRNNMTIYIKGINKTPLDYFELENKEFLKIKNYFSELFSPFFNQSPNLIKYIYNSKILNPIEIKSAYQEDFELNIELLDKNYKFIGANSNKIQIKDSFYLPKKVIAINRYKNFYINIKNFIHKRKLLLDNIQIYRKNQKVTLLKGKNK